MAIQLITVKQRFRSRKISHLPGELEKTLSGLDFYPKAGVRIAVAVGSRGMANLIPIVQSVVEFLKTKGARPFIVPAMGSHGGATAEGQTAMLAGLGVTEKTVGAPVVSSMEVVELRGDHLQHKVYMDKAAYDSDGIVLINRIKPHTDYHGSHESGLVKMSVVGLGKHAQAIETHRLGIDGLRRHLRPAAEAVFQTGKILFGLAVVEDAFDDTMEIKAIPADKILEWEPRLLETARRNMPSLPVNVIDILLVDYMGKNISGTGLDTNITGRIGIKGHPEPDSPRIKTIVVGDLTPESHGNALGMGLADIITRRLFDKIDFKVTYANAVTTTFLGRGKTPIVADNRRHALDIALKSLGTRIPGEERIVRIKDTLHLEEVSVTHAVYNEIRDRVSVLSDFEAFPAARREIRPGR